MGISGPAAGRLNHNAEKEARVAHDSTSAAVARAAGDESVYRQVLELVAVDLFDRGTLTMGQAARLLGLPVGAFIELCDRLGVPVLRESGRSVPEQVDSFERWLEGVDGSGEG